MSIVNYPVYQCSGCKSNKWWYRSGQWVCASCHPPPNELALYKARAMWANIKLYRLWQRLSKTPMKDREPLRAAWTEGSEKAKAIAQKLKDLDAKDCLYIEGGKKLKKCLEGTAIEDDDVTNPTFFCHCCPNDYWYQKEFMDLEKKRRPNDFKD